MPNRLAKETSPYLLQHRDNPVDWYPWGDEAIEKARREDRPIFLSIGYSACHWCHVMEHESFESEAIARVLNENFVPVKVDREERPDLDQIYMNAVQMLTGHGGWPMSVFLTPELKPFYGGTYWPPKSSRGMPGFDQILAAVIDAWKNRREHALNAADQLTAELQNVGAVAAGDAAALKIDLIDSAVSQLRRAFDSTYGGFGKAPKFPHPMDLQLLVRAWHRTAQQGALDMVRLTLDRMAAGGIYDHLGGGFARYSTDDEWLVPHFEKMLYDNALLARAYLHGWQVLGHERYRRICEETLDWMLREMRGPEGGFYSALDADSEGEEGRFYVWRAEEIREVIGNDPNCSRLSSEQVEGLLQFYGVSERGNFEGKNVLHLAGGADGEEPEGLAEMRRALFEARAQRVHPGLDDKRLTSWNALAIAALADAGAVLGREDYLDAARECAEFVLSQLRDADGRLLRTYKDDRAHLNAYLEDHAFLLEALLTLYESSCEQRWFVEALSLAESMIDRFGDPQRGGFYSTSSDHEELIARRKEVGDHPIPSGNSSAAMGLLRLGALTGERRYEEAAEGVF